MDDLNDVAWFAVLAYSVTSVGIAVATGPNMVLVLGAAALLFVLCAICYVNGYGSSHVRLLDEDLSHLEHHVMARLSALRNAAANGSCCVRWLKKGKLEVVSDIGFVVELDRKKVSYWVGIPSQQNERFEVAGQEESTSDLLERLRNLPVLAQLGWEILTQKHQSESVIQVSNPAKMIRISSEHDVVVDPMSASNVSGLLSQTMSMILDIVSA
jgi:hypothetical protein